MVKKVIIKIVMLVIICFSPTFVFSYDFTNIDDIKRCQGDPNCYVCSNNNTIAQCVQKNPYNSNKGVVDTSVFHWVCNEKEVKEACDIEIDEEVYETKSFNFDIKISDIITGMCLESANIEFKDGIIIANCNIFNFSTGNYENKKYILNINEKINSFIKPYIDNEDWKKNDSYIQLYYIAPDKECGASQDSFSVCKGSSYIDANIIKEGILTVVPLQKKYNYGATCECSNYGYANLNKFIINITLERPKTIITCPSDNSKSCYQEGDGYYCSSAECIAGDEAKIEIDEDPSINPDDLVDLDKDESQICSTDGIRIADGNFMSCRLPSSIFGDLTQNCCDMSMDNNEKKKDIISGASDVISAFAGTYALIFDIFEALGWADDDFLGVAIQDILNWFTDGVCSESEIMTSTLSKTTANSGNCVYLGTYCTNYSGTCHKWFGQIIGWYGQCERPAEAYCCYSSVFDKALAKAARDQMPEKYNWGSINGDLVFPNRLHSAGNNPCHPDYEKLNLNCNGVSISDLVNLNLDTPEFNADIEAYVDVLKEDMQKPGGAIDQSVDSANQVIEDIKNNPQDIIDDALKNIDIKGIE